MTVDLYIHIKYGYVGNTVHSTVLLSNFMYTQLPNIPEAKSVSSLTYLSIQNNR